MGAGRSSASLSSTSLAKALARVFRKSPATSGCIATRVGRDPASSSELDGRAGSGDESLMRAGMSPVSDRRR